MNARELFSRLMESPQPTRTEVLTAIETLTRNYNQEYTMALLSDFEDLLSEWKYIKVVSRLRAEYDAEVIKLDEEHSKEVSQLKAKYDKEMEAYYDALHLAQHQLAFGCNEPIEWPEEPKPFITPCRFPSPPFNPPTRDCYDDSLICVAPMYEYAVEVLRSKKPTDQDCHTSTDPKLPPELSTPQASEIFQRAKDNGLIDDKYRWLKGKQFLACFARRMSLELKLSSGINPDGTPRIKWQPFEKLFGYPPGKLRSNYNDVKGKYGESQEIESILNQIFH